MWFVIVLVMLIHIPAGAQQDAEYFQDEESSGDVIYFEEQGDRVPGLNKRGNIPATQVREWKEDDEFWYANKTFPKEGTPVIKSMPDKSYVPIAKRGWFQTLLWLFIIGGFAGVVFWFLSEKRVGLFNRKNKMFDATMEEEITEDIFSINYQKEIDKALAQENYRFAVRLMFLRVLSKMSGRNIIRYAQDKTNLDYMLELHSTSYYDQFFRIARNYEYSWYGQFEVNKDAFGIIKKDFDQFDKMLYRQ